jgi:hypothetical protein
MLNPIYASHLESAIDLLSRMKFEIIKERFISLKEETIDNIFKEKYGRAGSDRRLM